MESTNRILEASLSKFQLHFKQQLKDRLVMRRNDIAGGWKVTASARRSLLILVYTLLFVYIGACTYILLLYGESYSVFTCALSC